MNESDNVMRPERFRWLVVLSLLAGAGGLYLGTMSRGAFPGLPAKSLAWHLGLDSAPTLLDSLWGRLVALCAVLPGGSAAFWTGVLSAVCGAAGIALAALLMMRVRYPIHDPHDPEEVGREGQARLLAGLTTGLFLMLNIPFWILATRSLPGTFHVLLLVVSAWLFSEYQRTGKPSRLYWLGLVYGAGISEFPTFWVFAPLAALLVARAMLQRAEFSWPVLLRTGLCLLPGHSLYLVNGAALWADPVVRLRGFGSLGSVIWYIWRDQWYLIVGGPFIIVAVLTSIPWGVLYLMRPKKPAWRYSAWQVILRLVVLAVALLALFYLDLHQMFKQLMPSIAKSLPSIGLFFPLATPYLILAICAGTVAGEFWVMGQSREHRNAGIGQPLRRVMGLLGLLLPVAALVAGFRNLPVADGRAGAVADAMATEVLDSLQGRDVLLTSGVLDDSIQLLARRRGLDLKLVSLPQTASAPYRQYLAGLFPEPRQQALLQVGFSAFLQDFLGREDGLARTAALDLADPLREFGYLVPDRLVFRAEPTEAGSDLGALIEAQRPFWARMEQLAAAPLDPRNPAHAYRQYLLRLSSKVVNNIGFAQVERNDAAGAADTFKQARRIDPGNISALLNLLTIAEAGDLPEAAEYQAEWTEFKERQMDSRVMWSLGALYGYVHNTAYLVRHGMMWAVSGKPRMAEAELRRAAGGGAVNPEVKAFLGRAYLQSGDFGRSTEFYREALKENPRDVKSMLMLAEIAIGSEDFAEAESLLAKAEEAGVPAADLRFERAALALLKGQAEAALGLLKDLVAQDKENVRAWALLAMLTGDGRDNETYEKALKAITNLRGASPDVRLMLAELHVSRKEWAEARAELDQVTRMNPRQIRAWEMLVAVDFRERKRELAEDHVRALLTLDPENFTGNLMLGSFQYARGQHSLAESSYRAALESRRDPAALNDLAYLLMIKGGQMEEVRKLVEEALALQPENPVFLSTRGELNLREGRLDEAERDLQQVLAAMPDNAQALLLSAQLYAARGQKEPALEMAESLAVRQGELPAEQQTHLQDLLKQLR